MWMKLALHLEKQLKTETKNSCTVIQITPKICFLPQGIGANTSTSSAGLVTSKSNALQLLVTFTKK